MERLEPLDINVSRDGPRFGRAARDVGGHKWKIIDDA